MLKKLFSILVLFIILILVNTTAYGTESNQNNTNYTVIVEDSGNLLEEGDKSRLTDIMHSLSKYGNIYFKTTYEISSNTKQLAHDIYYSRFGSSSGCLLLIDMFNRQIYVHVDGEFRNTITDRKALSIVDNSYIYATRGEYGKCAYEIFSEMNVLFQGNAIAEPMRYISAALVALVSGFLFSFMIIFKQSRIQKAPASEVVEKAIVNFNITDIEGQKVSERRVYSPVSSSSSGSSHGGHGSGGGGHSSHSSHGSGGGGGHRF